VDVESCREGMAFATTDVRVESRTFRLLTEGDYFDPAAERSCRGAFHLGAQLQELAGIRLEDGRDRAVPAQVSAPAGTDQAAFFMLAAPIVIPIKILAVSPGRCFHGLTE